MKKMLTLIFLTVILAACADSPKSAKDIGKGISLEIQTDETIYHISFEKYEDGFSIDNGGVINANNSPFERGEIVFFDSATINPNKNTKIIIAYSGNINGTNAKETTISFNPSEPWAELILNNQLELELK